MEHTVFFRPLQETNINKACKLQKCVFAFADASRFWYLKLNEELIRLGTTPSKLGNGIFVWIKERTGNVG